MSYPQADPGDETAFETATCDHDWRVNPNIILPSNPPRQQLRCAKCGAITSRSIGRFRHRSNDPHDWPKA